MPAPDSQYGAPDSDLVCRDWATVADVQLLGDRYDALIAAQPLLVARMLTVSSELLFMLSARQFNVCSSTVRPTARNWQTDAAPRWFATAPSSWVGEANGWVGSWGFCSCSRPDFGCCSGPSRIRLGRSPVLAVEAVKVDGVTLAEATYALMDQQWLVRLPNVGSTTQQSWPCCQRIDLPSSETDTFEVTFTWGRSPPASGVMAAAELAGELALGAGGGECEVGPGVQTITRQGVTIQMQDFGESLVGELPTLARNFVKAVNPLGMRRTARVFSPDTCMPGQVRVDINPGS